MTYNPYDLLQVRVDGESTYARVLELDSVITDHIKSKNANGLFAVPSLAITTCPKCSQPIQVNLSLPQPPFPVSDLSCAECNPIPQSECAFIDPIATGRMTLSDLTPTEAPIETKLDPQNVGFKLDKFVRRVDKTAEVEETFEQATESIGTVETAVESTEASKPKKTPKKSKKKDDESNIG